MTCDYYFMIFFIFIKMCIRLVSWFCSQGQRTVYRLTLVKAWNTEELESYASLVKKGTPDFIEVKVKNRSKYLKAVCTILLAFF